jgi:diguanylate cyclase (GGDEF)-like protein/PAS domain S-box-containing protein
VTVPIPDDDRTARPEAATAQTPARGRRTLVRKWAYLISTTAYLPLSQAEIEDQLRPLVDLLIETTRGEPFDSAPAAAIGDRLVELRCVGRDSLRRTVDILGKALLHQPELRGVDQLAERVVQVLGALTSGYSDTVRVVTQRKQEDLNRTLLRVAQEAQRSRLVSEAQFDDVFAGSASGIALTGPDGRFLRVNAALTGTLHRSASELNTISLFDIFEPRDGDSLRTAYRDLLAGNITQLRQEYRLLRKDGETLWTVVAASVVRDADGVAQHVVVLVEHDTDMALLQKRLSHQSLHDPLTGLPNRQFFGTRLESALRHADPVTGISLFHLDLDGFSLITNGLSYEVGDRLLKNVAERLTDVVAGENAIVARLGADDFGILIENTPATPDAGTMASRINRELAEPFYPDGEHGVAASASIGVVHRPDPSTEPDELLRAADTTLRGAKSHGRGQWHLFDSQRDEHERARFALAASMPGAWENGEIRVRYRPMVSLSDEGLVGTEAELRWDHPEMGALSHDQCVELAEETGLILTLGTWLLRDACEEMLRWRENGGCDLPLTVALTENQAADPDLVGDVRRILDDTGLPPALLHPGLPLRALLSDHGDAADNLRVLADIGAKPAIHDFGAVGDISCLHDFPAHSVRVDRRFVDRQAAHADENPLIAPVLAHLVDIAHRGGTQVVVDSVDSAKQTGRWRELGADIALGAYFPAAAHELPGTVH